MKYRIYPSIGIARLGNSDEFFIGPEERGSRGVDLGPDGRDLPMSGYKDAGKNTRKQAARFRLFQFEDDADEGREAVLPAGARVEWTVRLVNMKDAVERSESNPPEPPAPGVRLRPTKVAARADRVIDSGPATTSGPNANGPALAGSYRGVAVTLGQLRTDQEGRLVVLGGSGRTESPTGASMQDFYNNPDYFDDVSDGPVSARVILADGTASSAEPAWVVVAPPDFAPAVGGLVTLLDLVRDVAYKSGGLQPPQVPSFPSDILPFLARCESHRWVNSSNEWASVPTAGAAIENPVKTPEAIKQRKDVFTHVTKALQGLLSHPDRADTKYELRDWQVDMLDRWVAGDFTTAPAADPPRALGLTYAALQNGVGYTLYPGIEVGVIMRDPSIYTSPFDFRIDHSQLSAGELTALMALPWQADFSACSSFWWPAQRPNDVVLADGTQDEWARPLASGGTGFVSDVMKFGFVEPTTDAQGRPIQREFGRADE